MPSDYVEDHGKWVLFHVVVWLALYAILGFLTWVVFVG